MAAAGCRSSENARPGQGISEITVGSNLTGGNSQVQIVATARRMKVFAERRPGVRAAGGGAGTRLTPRPGPTPIN